MIESFDLDAYLRRICYDGSREPSLTVLGAVVHAHARAVPYENIDVLLRRGASLDLAALQRKMVRGRGGGYCFEQNTLLEAGLMALGFIVTRLIARVVRGNPSPDQARRLHKVLRVDLPEGPYLADVGLGALTPTVPFALRLEQVQQTPHEPLRLIAYNGESMLQVRLGSVWDRSLPLYARTDATGRFRGQQLVHLNLSRQPLPGQPDRRPPDRRSTDDGVQPAFHDPRSR
jgi:N-hydroxyarylamine O-acetyltransferase